MMHKDTPYLNKLIKKRDHERSMEYHLQNIRQAKPVTRSPDSELLHINNKKKEYQKEVRFTEIERQNRILLEKISSIMGKDKRKTFNETSRTNKSLNSGFRKRQLQGIQIQNAKFLKRLQEKKSDYETTKFKEDWKKQKNTMKLMANYPLVITERPKGKRHSIGNLNQRSKIDSTDIELVRVRVLSSVNFLITVRLTHKGLQITGDCKETKQLKVIQIQKQEALEFIDEQCQGRIDLIFDHLRFDKGEGVLYLIGNEVQIDDILSKNRDNTAEEHLQQNIPQKAQEKQKNIEKEQSKGILHKENNRKQQQREKVAKQHSKQQNIVNKQQKLEQGKGKTENGINKSQVEEKENQEVYNNIQDGIQDKPQTERNSEKKQPNQPRLQHQKNKEKLPSQEMKHFLQHKSDDQKHQDDGKQHKQQEQADNPEREIQAKE